MRTDGQAKVSPRRSFRDRECSLGESEWSKRTRQVRGDRVMHQRLDPPGSQMLMQLIARGMVNCIHVPHVFTIGRDIGQL